MSFGYQKYLGHIAIGVTFIFSPNAAPSQTPEQTIIPASVSNRDGNMRFIA